MGYIPEDACWYLAEIIIEFIIEGDPRNVVHVNTHLIRADSPEEAYTKALALGRSERTKYDNTEGKKVTVAFRGLRELLVIYRDLEDGAEIMYSESVDVSKAKLEKWISKKRQLGVFAPICPNIHGPNYIAESIAKELEAAGFPRLIFDGSKRIKKRPKSGTVSRKRKRKST